MQKHPKDLKVKIGSPREVLWTQVKKEAEILIEQSLNQLDIQREMLELSLKIIAEEKKNFK